MSKNVETIRTAHENWNRRDFDSVLSSVSDNITYNDKARNQTLTNKQQFRVWIEEWAKGMPDGKITNPKYTDAGDTVIAQFTCVGTNTGSFGALPPTGKTLKFEMCEVCHFDNNNKVISAETYYDQYTILAQLGQVPPLAMAA